MVLIGLFLFYLSSLDAKIFVEIGKPNFKKPVLAINSVCNASSQSKCLVSKVIQSTFLSDMDFSNIFMRLSDKLYPAQSDRNKTDAWKVAGAEYLVNLIFFDNSYKVFVSELASGTDIIRDNYSYLPSPYDDAHRISNLVVSKLTGITKNIFNTKVAFIGMRPRDKYKNLFVMDYDGNRIKQLTFHKSISLSPAWSPDGNKIAYTRYSQSYIPGTGYLVNQNMYIYELASGKEYIISNNKGQNSGAAWSPDGKFLAMTLSIDNDPDIYFYNLSSNTLTPMVKGHGIDVEPSFSPDSNYITYSSSRSGNPEIYVMNIKTRDERRLTYVRYYNSSPKWSPNGDRIAFAGLDNPFGKKSYFDIFLVSPDGKIIERLTINSGNNENPYWSPDGRHLVFSSSRGGGSDLFFINEDGTGERRLTNGYNCYSPSWSPFID